MRTLFDSDHAFEKATPPVRGFAMVAVERGVDLYPDGLTYAIPQGLEGVREGVRVNVPLGRGDKPTRGTVVAVADQPPTDVDASRIK
ncbi:MAG: hypothetical protein ACO3NL_12700, partial [Phycisphaerales bacterium]